MAEARTEEDGNLPMPDLPSNSSNSSFDGASGTSFISLSLQSQRTAIEIRPPPPLQNNTIFPQRNTENVLSTPQAQSNSFNRATGTYHLLMHDIHDTTRTYQRTETNYRIRLNTFQNWCVPFMDPEVLAEAKFCYTGIGDIVQCTVCGGKLSNWQPGDNPRQEHLKEFGFSCR